MSDVKFIGGLNFKAKHPSAPDYVICKGSIKREDLIAWLQTEQGDWINFEVKESKSGKVYAAVDDWKPNQGGGSGGSRGGAPQRERPARATDQRPVDDFEDQDIPFIRQTGKF
jgi:hypothetical protein